MDNDFDQLSKAECGAVAEKIADMPVAAADKKIDDLAHRNGDDYIRKILVHLSPVKIAAILRAHDLSNPSILGWVMSESTIVKVLKTDPLFWENIHISHKSDHLLQIQNDVCHLITSMLINTGDRDRQAKILEYVRHDSLSLQYLFLPFVGWHIRKEQHLLFETPDTEIGTADHLYEIIRWAAPQVAQEVYNFTQDGQTPLRHFAWDLWSQAFDHFTSGHDYTRTETLMFAPAGALSRRES